MYLNNTSTKSTNGTHVVHMEMGGVRGLEGCDYFK